MYVVTFVLWSQLQFDSGAWNERESVVSRIHYNASHINPKKELVR